MAGGYERRLMARLHRSRLRLLVYLLLPLSGLALTSDSGVDDPGDLWPHIAMMRA
jgi:hypothetical protein